MCEIIFLKLKRLTKLRIGADLLSDVDNFKYKCNTNLKLLAITGTLENPVILRNVIEYCPNIECLDLELMSNAIDDDTIRHIANVLPNLKELALHTLNPRFATHASFPGLRALELFKANTAALESLSTFANNNPLLNALMISDYADPELKLGDLVTHLPQMTTLKIGSKKFVITDECLKLVKASDNHLENLSMLTACMADRKREEVLAELKIDKFRIQLYGSKKEMMAPITCDHEEDYSSDDSSQSSSSNPSEWSNSSDEDAVFGEVIGFFDFDEHW